MKKITFLIFCIALLTTDQALSQFLIKDSFFENTGVSNEGVVAGYVQQAGPYSLWNPDAGTLDEASLKEADYIIHLAGAGVADQRWTAARKKEMKRQLFYDLLPENDDNYFTGKLSMKDFEMLFS